MANLKKIKEKFHVIKENDVVLFIFYHLLLIFLFPVNRYCQVPIGTHPYVIGLSALRSELVNQLLLGLSPSSSEYFVSVHKSADSLRMNSLATSLTAQISMYSNQFLLPHCLFNDYNNRWRKPVVFRPGTAIAVPRIVCMAVRKNSKTSYTVSKGCSSPFRFLKRWEQE